MHRERRQTALGTASRERSSWSRFLALRISAILRALRMSTVDDAGKGLTVRGVSRVGVRPVSGVCLPEVV